MKHLSYKFYLLACLIFFCNTVSIVETQAAIEILSTKDLSSYNPIEKNKKKLKKARKKFRKKSAKRKGIKAEEKTQYYGILIGALVLMIWVLVGLIFLIVGLAIMVPWVWILGTVMLAPIVIWLLVILIRILVLSLKSPKKK